MPAPSFSRATAIQSLRTHDGIERLRNNLREEHMLKMDWVMTLLKHTLTPTQVARLLVQVRLKGSLKESPTHTHPLFRDLQHTLLPT